MPELQILKNEELTEIPNILLTRFAALRSAQKEYAIAQISLLSANHKRLKAYLIFITNLYEDKKEPTARADPLTEFAY